MLESQSKLVCRAAELQSNPSMRIDTADSTAASGSAEASLRPTGAGRLPYSCLVIERDSDVDSAMTRVTRDLPEHGFKTFVARSPESALGILRQWAFDAAVVDADGFDGGHVNVLRRLQPEFRAPVILLCGPQDERDQILSLESGATGIVTKPASSRLLAAKMRRLIEVGQRETEPGHVRVGPLAMHARHGIALVDDVPVKLTRHQFELLFLLASRAGRFVDRETIALRLRGSCADIGRSADVHVYRIRRKLHEHGVDSLHLDTVHGRGYMLTLDTAEKPDRRSPREGLHKPRATVVAAVGVN